MSLKPYRYRWLLGSISLSAAERTVLALFAVLTLAYAGLVPSFEGPDEPEHAAYVHAWAAGGTVVPP